MFKNKAKTAAQDAGLMWIYILILAGPWFVWTFVDSLLWSRVGRDVTARNDKLMRGSTYGK